MLGTDGVKGGDFSIIRNIVKGDIKAEEITNSGGILALIEAAHFDFTTMIGEKLAGGIDGTGKRVEDVRHFMRRRLLLVLRRHIASVELIKNVLPSLGSVVVGNFPEGFIETDLAFLLLRAVALDAVAVEEGLEGFLGNDGVLGSSGGGRDQGAGDEQKNLHAT